jgi:hypothetical protein
VNEDNVTRPSTEISARQKYLSYIAPIACTLLLLGLALWQIYYPVSMGWWAAEDGLFEYATALIYGASSLLFGLIARRGNFPLNSARRFGGAILLIGALGCFFMMGEEISWGQRIIGFDTPQYWADKNRQQEANLHNLDWVIYNLTSSKTGIFRANFFNLMIVGMGLALPVIALTPWARYLIAKLAVPVIPLRYAILFVGAWIYGNFLQSYAINPNTPHEVREFLYAIGILVFALTGFRRPWEVYRVTTKEMALT